MKFSSKRPQTSKSVSSLYKNNQQRRKQEEYNPIIKSKQQNQVIQIQNENKWQKVATKINQNLHLQKIIYNRTKSTNFLAKFGGKVYHSQSKQKHSQLKNQKKDDKQFKQKEIDHLKKYFRGSDKTVLRKKTQHAHNFSKVQAPQPNSTSIMKQLSVNKLFYQTPVKKIGFNMQFQEKLRFQHLKLLKSSKNQPIKQTPIIYFLKDSPFDSHIITQKNNQTPICISLFPEFFHSKLASSNYIRQRYFQKMKEIMNNTYDPQIMSKMAPATKYQQFNNMGYIKVLKQFIKNRQDCFQIKSAQNIVSKLGKQMSSDQMKFILKQIWEVFNKGNAIAHLDYILKDQTYVKIFKIAPYMNTRVITSRKILYHGGYSKTLYSSWHNYVKKSKTQLQHNFHRLNPLVQHIQGWFYCFQNINFYEINFIKMLEQPLSISAFKQIQLIKLAESQNILQNLWIRGVFLIIDNHKFLMKEQDQHKCINENLQNLRSILVQAKKKLIQLKTKSQKQEFILKLYTNYLKMLRKNQSIKNQSQLIQLHRQIQYDAKINLKNIFVLLNINYTKIVQNSFASLKQLVMQNKQQINFEGQNGKQKFQVLQNHPILKLHIIVDKQSLKFREKQDGIIQLFTDLIQKLFKVQLRGGSIAIDFSNSQTAQGEYPEIKLNRPQNQENAKNSILHYQYTFIHELQINQMMGKIHQYYKECGKVLNIFYDFLPFIKLTTSKHIFKDNQTVYLSAEQKFVKNLQIIEKYRAELKKIRNLYKIKIFQVDCSEPIKELKLRIDQIQYLIEQKHLNKIFDKINQAENKLAFIKTEMHSKQIKITNIEQIQEDLSKYSNIMQQINIRIQLISKQIFFCISKKRKTNTLVTRFEQLITKKHETLNQLNTFKVDLQKNKPQLQNKIKQQAKVIIKQIHELQQEFNDIQSHCFQLSTSQQFFKKIDIFDSKLKSQEKKIQVYIEDTQNTFLTGKLQQKFDQFQYFKERFYKISNFWRKVYSFQFYLKQIIKDQVINIDFKQYSQILQTSYEVARQMQKSMISADKKAERPLINYSQEHYLKKFIDDVVKCKKITLIVQIISNQKNMDRHWKQYDCQMLRQITLKELFKLNAEQLQKSLLQMNQRANMEYQIFQSYKSIQQWLRNSKIKIIDINGCDILDVSSSIQHIEALNNHIIQIQSLLGSQVSQVSQYFKKDLQKTLQITNKAYSNLVQWISYQQHYIKIANYYVPLQENSGTSLPFFDQLKQLHRKLIKSFDHDDSIWFVSQNVALPLYSKQIILKLQQIQKRLKLTLKNLKQKYPRLFLLNNDELLQIMSSGGKIQKLLKKCLNHIQCFDIKEGTIQRIGKKKHLKFAQPIYILDKLSDVDEWMFKLEESIKKTLKQLYKVNLVSSLTNNKNSAGFVQSYPTQLFILDQFIQFTQDMEDSIENNLLRTTKEIYIKKMQENFKNNRSQSMVTMLYIIFRQVISSLLAIQNLNLTSFQWIKLPHFYHCQTLSFIDPKVVIMNAEYVYGFNYLQNQELFFNDLAFFGNTFVGESRSGKKSLCQHYAYITGSQLLMFNPSVYFKSEQNISIEAQCLDNLINMFKLASSIGCWLYVDKCHLFSYESMNIISQCISVINEAISSNSSKVNILEDTIVYNKATRVFLSIDSLNNKSIPSRLISKVRPMFVMKPNSNFLLKLYLQSKTQSYQKLKKILTFTSWRQHGQQVPMNIINWIRKQDVKTFSITVLINKLVQCGYMTYTRQITQQLDKNFKNKSQDTINTDINLQDQISFAKYEGLLVFGPKSSGKTYQILNIIQKSTYLKIDLGVYSDKKIAVQTIIQTITKSKIKPQFLLIRKGLPFYSLFQQLTQYNVRLIFVQNNLNKLHTALIHNLTLINFKYIKNSQISKVLKKPKLSGESRQKLLNIQHFPQQKIICEILEQKYTKILEGSYSALLIMLEQNVYNKYQIRNIRISFAKIFKTLLSQNYKDQMAFFISILLSYGSYIEQKKIIQCLKDLIGFNQTSEPKRKQFQNKFFEQKLYTVINGALSLIKEGQILSIFDFVPTKGYTFNINNQSKIQIDQFLQGKKQIYLNLGYIQNIILLTQINHDLKIKMECRDWLTTILAKMSGTQTMFIKKQCQNFDDFLKKLISKIKAKSFFFNFNKFTQIIVDDVHLYGFQTYNYIQELSNYLQLFYINPQKFNRKALTANEGQKYTDGSFLKDKMNRIILGNCRFTLGMKVNFTDASDQKSICIKIKQHYIQTIYQQFLREYWYSSMKVDRSFQHLLLLSSSLQKKYGQNFKYVSLNYYEKPHPFYLNPVFNKYQNIQQKQVNYFWFKNPLLILFNSQHVSFSDYFNQYLRIVVDTLPIQFANIVNLNTSLDIQLNRSSHQLQNNLSLKSLDKIIAEAPENQYQSKLLKLKEQEVKKQNMDAKLKILNQKSKKQLFEMIKNQFTSLNTKQITKLPEVKLLFQKIKQEDQMEHEAFNLHVIAKITINFEFTQYLKENVIKIFRNLQNHSLILLGQLHTQRDKALKIAVKFLDYTIIQYKDNFFQQVDKMGLFNKKIILFFKSSDINQKSVRNLQKVIKSRSIKQNGINIFDKFRFVLKINTENNVGKIHYEKFAFLKSNFVTIFFIKCNDQQAKMEQMEQQRRVLKNGDLQITNDLQLEWKKDMNYIYSTYKLMKDFKLNFVQLYRVNNKSQYEKLEYYRKITSQMVVNIDRLAQYTNSIPSSLKQTSDIFTKINEKKLKLIKDIEKYNQLYRQTQQQIKYINQLLQQTKANKETLSFKIQKIINPIRIKMQKIQRKLENLQSIQYLKLKNIPKTQISTSIIIVLNLLLEQSQQKDRITLSLPFTKNTLIGILKQLKKNQFLFKPSQDLKQKIELEASFNLNLKNRLQEVKSNSAKRYEKYGPIYKYMFEWLMLYYEKNQIFEDYNTKFKYTFNTILSQLSNLSKNSQKNIEGQKQSLYQQGTKAFQLTQKQQKPQRQQNRIQQSNNNMSLSLNQSYDDSAAIIKKLQKQQQYLDNLDKKIKQLVLEMEKLCGHQNSLNRHKKSMITRHENLGKIIKLLSDQDYMKSVSSNIAAYFKNIPKISFLKTLQQIKFNQFVDDQKMGKYKLDISHYCNIFSQNQNLRLFKIKHQLYNLSNEDIEYIYYIANTQKKIMVVQDKDSLLKGELCRVCHLMNYNVLNINDMPCEAIEQLALKKLKNHQKLLLINDNFYYNPTTYHAKNTQTDIHQIKFQPNKDSKNQYWPNFSNFLSTCQRQLKQKTDGRLVIVNFLQPVIQTEHYNEIGYGKIALTYQKFMADLTNIFQIIQHSQLYRNNLLKVQKNNNFSLQKSQQKAGRNKEYQRYGRDLQKVKKIDRFQIDNLINTQNNRMKQTLKKLQNLTQSILEKSYSILEATQTQINSKLINEEQLISAIENNLYEVHKISQTVQNFFKTSSNYRDQNQINKNQINKSCLSFYGLYKYLQKISNYSQNSVFSEKQLYHQWLKLVRKLKSDNQQYFVPSQHGQFSMQTISSTKKNKFMRINESQKQFTIVSQVFQQNLRSIYKEIVIRIGKSIVWQSKQQLYSYISFSLIVFFLNDEMLKAKPSQVIHMKRMVDYLLLTQNYDYTILQRIKKYFSQNFTKAKPFVDTQKQKQREQAKKQFQDLSTALLSFLMEKKKKEINQSQMEPIWVQLIKVKFSLINLSELFESISGQKSKNKSDCLGQVLIQRLQKHHPYAIQIIRQLLRAKHSFKSISVVIQQNPAINTNLNFLMAPIATSIQFLKFSQKQKQLCLIQQLQTTLPFILQGLKFKAISSKKQFVSLRYNILEEEKSLLKIVQYYQTGNTWIYIPNIINSARYSNIISRILYKIKKSNFVPNFKIFVLLPKRQNKYQTCFSSQNDSNFEDQQPLLYNKYEIYKLSNQNDLNFERYFNSMIKYIQNKSQDYQIDPSTFKDLGSIKTMNKLQVNALMKPLSQLYQCLKVSFDNLFNKQKKFQKSNKIMSFINFVSIFQRLQMLQQNQNVSLRNQSANAFMNVIKFIQQFYKNSNFKKEDLIQNIQVWKKLRNQGMKLDLINDKSQTNINFNIFHTHNKQKNVGTHKLLFNVNNFQQKQNQILQNNELFTFLINKNQISQNRPKIERQKGDSEKNCSQNMLRSLIIETLSKQSQIYYTNCYLNFLIRITNSKIYKEGMSLTSKKNQIIQTIKYLKLQEMIKFNQILSCKSIWIGSKKLKQYQKSHKVHLKDQKQLFSILYYRKSEYLDSLRIKNQIEQKKTSKQINNQKGTKQKISLPQKIQHKLFQQIYMKDFGLVDCQLCSKAQMDLKCKQIEKHMMKNKFLSKKLNIYLKHNSSSASHTNINSQTKSQSAQIAQLLKMYSITISFEEVYKSNTQDLQFHNQKICSEQYMCTIQLTLK